VALVVFLVFLIAALYMKDRVWWRVEAPSRARFPLRGIDVSHHQGTIDWPRVAASGEVQFAYVKATEGTDHIDDRFDANWAGARDAGLRVGAYHFFSFCRPGGAQAMNFLRAVHTHAGVLPPAVDVEYEGNCAVPSHPADIRRELEAWLTEVEVRIGMAPVIYFTRDSYAALKGAAHARHRIWIRSLGTEPDPLVSWTSWQFTDEARIPGIARTVDMSVARSSL
jgi:lysozyme